MEIDEFWGLIERARTSGEPKPAETVTVRPAELPPVLPAEIARRLPRLTALSGPESRPAGNS